MEELSESLSYNRKSAVEYSLNRNQSLMMWWFKHTSLHGSLPECEYKSRSGLSFENGRFKTASCTYSKKGQSVVIVAVRKIIAIR